MKKRRIALIIGVGALCLTLCAPAAYGIAKFVEQRVQDAVAESEQKVLSPTFPVSGDEVDILKPAVTNYIAAMHQQAQAIENDYILHDFYVMAPDMNNNYGAVYSNETDLVRIDDYWAGSSNNSRSKNIALVFDAQGFASNTVYTIRYGLQSDLSDALEIETTEKYATVQNLLSNRTYYWQVVSGKVSSTIESFHTKEGFRMISADGVNNIRDMGGRSVYGGKHIKQGLIFRGAELVEETYQDSSNGSTHSKTLNEENKRILRDDLGIKLEIDFRGDTESNNLVNSPLYVEGDEKYGDIDYMRIPNMSGYDWFFSMHDEAQIQKVHDMFTSFADAENKHVYFHCWGGADRTGTAAFFLGAILGTSLTDLIIDFELTSFSGNFRPHYANDAKKIYRFPSLLAKLKYAKKKGSSSETYWEADKPIADICGEMLNDYFGVTPTEIAAIRSALLED